MISVITVSFNAADCIERTVRSVCMQNDDSFEFILVDGGSTDGTVSVVKRIVRELNFPDARFLCVSEKDRGVYDAMNKGVMMAHGSYVQFMNGGDSFFDANVLTKFEQMMDAVEADAYYGNTMMEFYEGRGIHHENEEWHRDAIMPFIHQSVIVKRSLLMIHPFDLSYRVSADKEFFYWMRQYGCRFHYEDFVVSNYDAKEGISENNPYLIALEGDRILGLDRRPGYWLRRIKLRVCKGIIQPIKDYAPRWMLNRYFRWKKRHIIWVE